VKSAVTICLVPEARSGPFVFHDGLADGCSRAASHGFDAIEILPRTADEVDAAELRALLASHGLSVAAFGTGAGWIVQRLSLTAVDAAVRMQARKFIGAIIELAGSFGAPAIIGSMQGRLESHQDREQAINWFRAALNELGQSAAVHGVPLLVEPLNRYESNVLNRLGQTVEFVQTLETTNVRILADLFHMNIEEVDMAAAIRCVGPLLGHVDFADSNRQAMGFGHTDIDPVISAIRQIGYTGYLAAEVFPLPTAEDAARQSIAAIRRLSKSSIKTVG
jgi:sugar phosphate isomerase/epimerase